MSQNKHSEAQRRRTFKRVRGVILILLVVGLIVWGVTALIRRGAGTPDPTPDPNAGQQTEQPGGLPEPDPATDPDPVTDPDPATEPDPVTEPKPKPKPDPSPEPGNSGLTNPGSDDWRTILVSAKYPLAEEMEMERETVGWPVDARIAQPLKDFLAAAKADGYTLQVISGYRTFARSAVLLENEVQAQMKYNGYSREKAEQVAATRVAPPGTSEHNTGLAVDILSGDYYNHHSQIEESFEYDAEAAWMKAHCAEYGFILRYPKDKQDVTGIIFEPWHFRYVGVEIATYIMQNGLTLEEYLGVA